MNGRAGYQRGPVICASDKWKRPTDNGTTRPVRERHGPVWCLCVYLCVCVCEWVGCTPREMWQPDWVLHSRRVSPGLISINKLCYVVGTGEKKPVGRPLVGRWYETVPIAAAAGTAVAAGPAASAAATISTMRSTDRRKPNTRREEKEQPVLRSDRRVWRHVSLQYNMQRSQASGKPTTQSNWKGDSCLDSRHSTCADLTVSHSSCPPKLMPACFFSPFLTLFIAEGGDE